MFLICNLSSKIKIKMVYSYVVKVNVSSKQYDSKPHVKF